MFNAFANFYATPVCTSPGRFMLVAEPNNLHRRTYVPVRVPLTLKCVLRVRQSATIFLVWPYFYEMCVPVFSPGGQLLRLSFAAST